MRVFVAGAGGAVGLRLIPHLNARGHEVVGTTRSDAKGRAIRALGAEPVVLDALDRAAVLAAVRAAAPDVIVHELTALAGMSSLRRFDHVFAATNRLRTEGLDHLLDAARESGVRRFVAQSYAGWPNERRGGLVKAEDDPLDPNPRRSMRKTLRAIEYVERTVTAAPGLEGVVLRYGGLYGPGTSLADGSGQAELVRRGRFPIVGEGSGVWSFVHVDDAAAATAVAVERGAPGVYNIVDDDPAPVSVWLPYLAHALGANAPRRVPAWLGRLVAGEAAVLLMTEARGSSNAKAKAELGWQPHYASWREGFLHGLADEPARTIATARARQAA